MTLRQLRDLVKATESMAANTVIVVRIDNHARSISATKIGYANPLITLETGI